MSRARPATGRRDRVCLLVLLGLVFLCLWDTVILGRTLALRDVHSLFGPLHDFLRTSVVRGELPLWNPHLYGGHPFLANPQSGVCYPLTYLTLLLPVRAWLHVTIGLHMLILGAGSFYFAREIGVGRVGASWSAAVIMLSGLSIKLWEFVPQFQATAWLPLAFLFLRRLIFRKRTGDAVLLGFTLALQLTAGHPYPLFFTVLGLSICALVWLTRDIADSGDVRLSTVGRLLLAALVFVGLSAVQWMPLRELLQHHVPPGSWRPALSQGFSLHPAEWIVLLMPDFFGFPAWQKCFYLGLLPLLLMPLAFGKNLPGARTDTIGLAILMTLGLTLALGSHAGLVDVISRLSLPIARMLKWPTSAMVLFVFGAAMLSGIGLDRLLRTENRRAAAVLIAPAAVVLAVLAVLAITPSVRSLLNDLRASYATRLLVYASQDIRPGSDPLAGVTTRFALVASVSLLALCLLARRPQRMSIAVLFIVISLDLYTHFRAATVVIDENIYTRTPPALQKIIDRAGGDVYMRVLHTFPTGVNDLAYGSRTAAEYDVLRGAAAGAIGIPYGLHLAGGVGPLAPFRTVALTRAPERLPPDDRERIYRLLCIGLVTRVDPVGIFTYEASAATIADPLPRAYLVPDHLRVGSDKEMLRAILRADHNPRARVVLSGLRPLDLASTPGGPVGIVESTDDRGDSVLLRLRDTTDSILVLTDAFDPGWTATVDNRSTRIYRANGVQRAIAIPAGSREVLFRYRPRGVVRGAWISALTIAGILLGGVIARTGVYRGRHSRRKESPQPAAPATDPQP